jgi:hypothetical protein
MKDGYTGEKLKGACNKIIVISFFANAGIGIKAGYNGIMISHIVLRVF